MSKVDIHNIKTLKNIIEHLNTGMVVLDDENRVLAWNLFMSDNSGIPASGIVGRDIFEVFPYLPRQWMELKFRSVRLIKNYSFVSWTRRPYLFKFKNKDMIRNPDIEYMRQDCTFIPVTDQDTGMTCICISITDMTQAASAQKQLDAIRDLNKTLELMTNHDGLTGLYNRTHIEKLAAREFSRSKRYGTPFSIVFFDIDHFKNVNDTYGHMGGDKVLKSISNIITRRLRETDSTGRYGGEEFIVLLPETGEDLAANLAEQLRKTVEDAVVFFEDQLITFTISLGVVAFRADMKNHLEMIHEADIALYQSKAAGRNTVTRYKSAGKE